MLEAHQRGNFFQLFGADSAGIGRADHRPDAGPGDEIHRDIFFFQYLQDANVRKTAGKASAQRYADQRPALRFSGRFLRRLVLALEFTPEGLY